MNADSQRIAIAEACGWTKTEIQGLTWQGWCAPEDDPKLSAGPLRTLPDYLNSLEEMHCAELVLAKASLAGLYCDHLASIVGIPQVAVAEACHNFDPANETTHPSHFHFTLANATAKQRAEAFVKTIGLWTQ